MSDLYRRSKRIILIIGGIAALAGGPAATIASAEPSDGSGYSYDYTAAKKWFDQRVSDYNSLKDTNPPAAADAKKDAQFTKGQATEAGCDTSGWVVPFVITSNPYLTPVTVGYAAQPPARTGGTTTSTATVILGNTRAP
jgi:hypothetical protein